MDAYIFVRQADEDVIASLRDLHAERPQEVRYVTDLAGPWDAFVAVEVATHQELRRTVLSDIRRAGARQTDTSIAVRIPLVPDAVTGVPTPKGPRRWRARPVEAYVRVRTLPGMAHAVLNTVVDLHGFLGAAIVAGAYDILLGMGANTFGALADDLLDQLHQVDGIVATKSSFATNDLDDSA